MPVLAGGRASGMRIAGEPAVEPPGGRRSGIHTGMYGRRVSTAKTAVETAVMTGVARRSSRRRSLGRDQRMANGPTQLTAPATGTRSPTPGTPHPATGPVLTRAR
ncbi:hypothetical protein [Planotetraspora mira]|uniref:Uncharacterized protein n=1 Tax=Planotetraspora mira TaxID=58121 RepID=A0A8J3TSP9_9ACTN|nr:hypothetical protein [Planotetraspora mira]GII31813.1 hypothetical protein Pmi06nite_52550 [Planotetraspora mira]